MGVWANTSSSLYCSSHFWGPKNPILLLNWGPEIMQAYDGLRAESLVSGHGSNLSVKARTASVDCQSAFSLALGISAGSSSFTEKAQTSRSSASWAAGILRLADTCCLKNLDESRSSILLCRQESRASFCTAGGHGHLLWGALEKAALEHTKPEALHPKP